ncbi:MAG: SUMF1/EgtB/PvdO family nonheme iron enzyme [Lentisphaeria bacterium]|nr:SUMF1/EgtB/PvdO family nonheme iron enzyme [Lentisphaeria bacterium]
MLDGEVPAGNNSGIDRPVSRILWNDLLTACRTAREQILYPSSLPPGYIIRPLTEEEWEYCASAGKGVCTVEGKVWSRETTRDPLPDAGSLPPNAFGLHDLFGGLDEMVLSCRHEHPDSFITRGGSWKMSRKSLPKARTEAVFYQSFVQTRGARLAVAPGTPDLLEKEFLSGTPNHLEYKGRHFEFFGHLSASYTREAAAEVCRLLGGRLASVDSRELQKLICSHASPVIGYFTCVGAVFREGKWVWENGKPLVDPPRAPVPGELFSIERSKFRLRKMTKYLGFVCEWSGEEWRDRQRWRSRADRQVLTEFTLGDRHYVLFLYCCHAYPHLLRRYAQILGGRLAEPESSAEQTAIAEKIRNFQTVPTLLGGIRKFRDFYWLTSGKTIPGPLPLTGRLPDNAPSLATPAMVNGKLCSVQLASQYLVEFPVRSAAE